MAADLGELRRTRGRLRMGPAAADMGREAPAPAAGAGGAFSSLEGRHGLASVYEQPTKRGVASALPPSPMPLAGNQQAAAV